MSTNTVTLLAALVAIASFATPLMRDTAEEFEGFVGKGTISGVMMFVFTTPIALIFINRISTTNISAAATYILAVIWLFSVTATVGFSFLVAFQLEYSNEQLGYISVTSGTAWFLFACMTVLVPFLTENWSIDCGVTAIAIIVSLISFISVFGARDFAKWLQRQRWDCGIRLSE